ncbi:hypothetical protein G3M48_007603 [Beauveria asiatica]|uniref:Aminoglycoside phosphotransferase domain-containing protein n=1 Tax=Beauveria asiatica TaxID=1069075 RepID=A0AAW0RMQ2_9HYPO
MSAEKASPKSAHSTERLPEPEPETKSLQDALDDDDNALVSMRYRGLEDTYRRHIESNKKDIEKMIYTLLGVRWCRIMTPQLWKSGSFNLAIPVFLPQERTVYLRLPLYYRLGEDQCPGNVEEKLRTEIATYQWVSENCADVPIPTLHAFGLPDGSTILHLSRDFGHFFNALHDASSDCLLLFPTFGDPSVTPWITDFFYLAKHAARALRLARISLSLNSIPFKRIGALSLQPNLSIAMTNRPLHFYFHLHENEGIPLGIPRDRTYAETEAYISDLITFQDNKLRHQPNSVHNVADCRKQVAALFAMRGTMHHFIKPELRDGPFFYTLTDLHPNNVFVDEHWNVQCVIDLEWAHSMPLQMQRPPYWLTSKTLDAFDDDEAVSEYAAVLDEYFQIYENEERRRNHTDMQTSIQRDMWRKAGDAYLRERTLPERANHGVPWLESEQRARAEKVLNPLWENRSPPLTLAELRFVSDCHVIAIDPQHQGRKAGALIVQWGINLGEQPSILSRRRPPSACTRRWASRCLRSKIVHEAALFGADKDIVVPLMVRMPSCAKGVTFKEWCETGYPELTVADQL